MLNFDIGLSGLRVAQRAIELIGTNIVNAGTEGYHRQSLRIVPNEYGTGDMVGLGGAQIASVTRSIDNLLEREILYQQPLQGQVEKELSVLELIEQALGGLGSQGIANGLEGFFNAMNQLAGQPDSQTLRQQVVWSGQQLTQDFNHLWGYLRDLSTHLVSEAQTLTGQVNSLIERIAANNQEIRMMEMRGANSNILRDQRDQSIYELSQLVDVQVEGVGNAGMVNLSVWGTPVITGPNFIQLECSLGNDNQLGVMAQGGTQVTTDVSGGQIGGLVALRNRLVTDVRDGLDALARQVILAVNAVHAEGIGTAGSFSQLTGQPVAAGSTPLSQLDPPIQAGVLAIRVTEVATGESVIHEVTIADPSAMTLDQLVAAIDAVPGVGASLSAWTPYLQADNGYQFDFLAVSHAIYPPADWTAGNTSSIEVAGRFSGADNALLDVRVEGGGQVGISEGLNLAVYDADGNLLGRHSVGLGYAAGDSLDLGNGLSIQLSAGTLVEDDSFELHAQARSDTAGVLTALGLNTFFLGRSAADIAVRPLLLANPSLLAAAGGVDGTDNAIATRLAQVGAAASGELDGMSPSDYFAQMSTSVGQAIDLRQARQVTLESVVQQLANQRDEVGGVDVNDEAAKLILFERMFQAAAKFMTTQSKSLEYLMSIV